MPAGRGSRRKRGRVRGRCGREGALAVGKKGAVVAIGILDGRVTVFFEDAPVPAETTADDCWVLCVHCMGIEHPESREGMRLARLTDVPALSESEICHIQLSESGNQGVCGSEVNCPNLSLKPWEGQRRCADCGRTICPECRALAGGSE